MKFSIKDFLLNKSLMENFVKCPIKSSIKDIWQSTKYISAKRLKFISDLAATVLQLMLQC